MNLISFNIFNLMIEILNYFFNKIIMISSERKVFDIFLILVILIIYLYKKANYYYFMYRKNNPHNFLFKKPKL